MKIVLILFVAAGIAGWMYRDRLGPVTARTLPGETGVPASIQRLTETEYARQVHDNVSLRVQLSKQYPEAYKVLAQQTKRPLHECIVTEVVPGVLKATCR